MPYSNVPESKTQKMDDCVKKVKAKGKDKKRAIAICYSSIVKKAKMASELDMGKEVEKEHTSNPKEAEKIANDHLKEDPKYYTHLLEMKKKYGAKHTKLAIARCWKARMTGVAQIPAAQTKYVHGREPMPKSKIAKHSVNMTNFALVDVAFMREGNFRTNGIPFNYKWDVIERDGKTWEGKEFYIDHIEKSNTEYGLIDKIYTKVLDGTNWLCAKVKVPETSFTKAFLERIENGLVRYVSSTHQFFVNPSNDAREVEKIRGLGISTVKEPEVEGARILSCKRNLRG